MRTRTQPTSTETKKIALCSLYYWRTPAAIRSSRSRSVIVALAAACKPFSPAESCWGAGSPDFWRAAFPSTLMLTERLVGRSLGPVRNHCASPTNNCEQQQQYGSPDNEGDRADNKPSSVLHPPPGPARDTTAKHAALSRVRDAGARAAGFWHRFGRVL